MLDEVVRHLKGETSLEKVYFILYDQVALDTFQDVWQAMKRKGL